MQLSGTFGECSENSCSEHFTGQRACLLMIAFFHNLCFTQGPNIFGLADRRCHFKHNLMHSQHCNHRPIRSRQWTTIICSYTDTLHSCCCYFKNFPQLPLILETSASQFSFLKRPFCPCGTASRWWYLSACSLSCMLAALSCTLLLGLLQAQYGADRFRLPCRRLAQHHQSQLCSAQDTQWKHAHTSCFIATLYLVYKTVWTLV